ncbi:MAG: alpha/beta hydrolase [Mycobacterium sp.]
MSTNQHADGPPSLRTLRLDSFATRWERLTSAAQRHAVPQEHLVLPADGIVPRASGPALHYLEWPGCAADTPVVLMLHGGGLHAHTFDLTGNLLRCRARCLAIDLRGHGESDWVEPTSYGSDAICEDIDAVIAALKLEDVVVVGHSLGGMGAMVWAGRRPAALSGLVIVDVAPEMDAAGIGSVGAFVTTPQSFIDLEDVQAHLAADFPTNAPRVDGVAANLRWGDDGRLTFKYDSRQFMAMKLELRDDLRRIVRQIVCPTKILRGERSHVTSEKAAAELAGLIPSATWKTIPNAGHTIQSSNPAALAAEVLAFFDEIRPTTTAAYVAPR